MDFGGKKKPKENIRASLERSSTPRITKVDGNTLKIISTNVAGLRGLLKNEDKKNEERIAHRHDHVHHLLLIRLHLAVAAAVLDHNLLRLPERGPGSREM